MQESGRGMDQKSDALEEEYIKKEIELRKQMLATKDEEERKKIATDLKEYEDKRRALFGVDHEKAA